MPPPGRKASSKLPGPGLRDRHSLFSAAGNGNGGRLAWRSGWHTQDHPRLPSGGEVRHVGWRCVHAQTGPEWNGDAEGQPCLGIRKYYTGGQLHAVLSKLISVGEKIKKNTQNHYDFNFEFKKLQNP